MGQRQNVQKQMDAWIEKLEQEGRVPHLLLHSCCAPCSSYVLEYLSQYLKITVFYYNPNIFPKEEYQHRKEEQQRLIREGAWKHPVDFLDCDWETEAFLQAAKGLEQEREGGRRCTSCFDLRLGKTAEAAKKGGYDCFATTLTISPLKNAPLINQIGAAKAEEYGVFYLPSDFKKRGGYQRSIVLSKNYHLYRQDYCGCTFSKREREMQKEQK